MFLALRVQRSPGPAPVVPQELRFEQPSDEDALRWLPGRSSSALPTAEVWRIRGLCAPPTVHAGRLRRHPRPARPAANSHAAGASGTALVNRASGRVRLQDHAESNWLVGPVMTS